MTRRDFLLIAAAASLPRWAWGQRSDSFADLVALAGRERWEALPIGELTAKVGLHWLGTPYVGSTLETSDDEEVCTVRLDGFDCVTFYEAALAFARTLKLGQASWDGFVRQVESMRYRGGTRRGYLSRIHYTSEWLTDNERRGLVKNLTRALPGAERLEKSFDFMSSHPTLYRQLRAHPEWLPEFRSMEMRVSKAKPWFVPKSAVGKVEDQLASGDIVGITTSKSGLDTSHTGLLFREGDGDLRLLHASSSAKKVVLGPRLSDYLQSIASDTGIMVCRPLEPKRG